MKVKGDALHMLRHGRLLCVRSFAASTHCTFISAGDMEMILANAGAIYFTIEPQGIAKGGV